MLTLQIEQFSAPDNANFDLIMRAAAPRGFMQPLDVANVIAFLASEAASYIVGETIEINGGQLMR